MPSAAVPPHNERTVTAPAVQAIERPIGQMILGFAMLEQALDFWLIEVFPIASKANIGHKMPHQLGQKLQYLRDAFERLAALSALREKAMPLLLKAAALSEMRNAVTHGALSHYIEAPERKIVFGRLKYSKDRGVHILDDVVVSFADIHQAADQVSDIVAAMHVVALELQRQVAGRTP